MSYHFKPAKRENVSLLIGLIGPTGSGKTYSAFELAAGIAGDKPFGVIDTEARRALHYADQFKFDHCEFKPPFRPDNYTDAIKTADDAGYPVIVVDSASHSHAGEGGLLDWHDEELERMAGNDWKKRERATMAAWIKPKMSHKKMVQRLLQVRAHLILCFRAEEKTKMLPDPDRKGKVKPTSIGFQPICEKNLPYELTCSMLFDSEQPGFPIPLKIQEQHRHLFPTDQPVGRKAGEGIRVWASGEAETGEVYLGDILGEISAAGTPDELETIGKNIADMGLSQYDRSVVKTAYMQRHGELGK